MNFRIQSSQGIDFGTFEATDARAALDVMARDAGYASHVDACETTGEDATSWTSNRYEFLGGTTGLLVTEV